MSRGNEVEAIKELFHANFHARGVSAGDCTCSSTASCLSVSRYTVFKRTRSLAARPTRHLLLALVLGNPLLLANTADQGCGEALCCCSPREECHAFPPSVCHSSPSRSVPGGTHDASRNAHALQGHPPTPVAATVQSSHANEALEVGVTSAHHHPRGEPAAGSVLVPRRRRCRRSWGLH